MKVSVDAAAPVSVQQASEEARIVRIAVEALSRRWTIPVLARLCVEPTQFNQLRRDLGISSKVLTSALRALERDGLVVRTSPDYAGKAGSYALTPRSAELQPALRALYEWARTHGEAVEQSRIRFDQVSLIVPGGSASQERTE